MVSARRTFDAKVFIVSAALMLVAAAVGHARSEPVASSPVGLSLDQQSKIGEMITNKETTPLINVDFSVALGGAVPAHVQLRPLPPGAAELAPQLRDFSYIVVEELIALVEPKARTIAIVFPRWRPQEAGR